MPGWRQGRCGGLPAYHARSPRVVHLADHTARVTIRQASMSTDTPRHPHLNANPADFERSTATILIIEDNQSHRELAEQMLDIAHYPYLSTKNVEEGWRLLQRGGVNLVVTDLTVNAFALIERMRAHPLTSTIPVVVASGTRAREVQQAAIDAGAANYLTKPYTYDDLISTIERCLAGK